MRVERSPIRLKGTNLSKPVLKSLSNGSIVHAKVFSNISGKSFLLLGSEKIPVKLSSNLASGSYDFQVGHEKGAVIFKVLEQKPSLNLLDRYNLPSLPNSISQKLNDIARFILANGFALSKSKLQKVLILLNSLEYDASWFEIIFLLDDNNKKSKLDFKRMREKIISLLHNRQHQSSEKQLSIAPNFHKLEKLLRKLVDVGFSDIIRDDRPETGFPNVNFLLLPLKIGDSNELLPIIFLKSEKNNYSSHLFCELDLQVVGSVKLFLKSSFNSITGFVYCQEQFVGDLTSGLQNIDNIKVKSFSFSDSDIFEWPFELLLELEAESNGLDYLT